MQIRAVSFDIGHTLVRYNNPLNWKALYAPALRQMGEAIAIEMPTECVRAASDILSRYNTREHPREKEVCAADIFGEILNCLGVPLERMDAAMAAFYSFFQAEACCYDDVERTLHDLREQGIRLGALTDVAYGMENAFSMRDIAPIHQYFDKVFTSVDVGWRKPNKAGFLMLLDALGVQAAEMLYVGDEEKDIAGANAVGISPVLVCRAGNPPDWGQRFTVRSLAEVCKLV